MLGNKLFPGTPKWNPNSPSCQNSTGQGTTVTCRIWGFSITSFNSGHSYLEWC